MKNIKKTLSSVIIPAALLVGGVALAGQTTNSDNSKQSIVKNYHVVFVNGENDCFSANTGCSLKIGFPQTQVTKRNFDFNGDLIISYKSKDMKYDALGVCEPALDSTYNGKRYVKIVLGANKILNMNYFKNHTTCKFVNS